MKKIYSRVIYALCFLIGLTFLIVYGNDSTKFNDELVDPVLFKMESSKSELLVGETFVINITAYRNNYLINSSRIDGLDMNFNVKLVFPDGFIQTGGNYYDFIEGNLTNSVSTLRYRVEGKFLYKPSSTEFRLIRGTKGSKDLNKYILKAKFSPKVKEVESKSMLTKSASIVECPVNKVRLIFRSPGDCCMDRLPGAKIQGSNDGANWTDLYTFSTNGTGNWQEFTFSNTTAYTNMRFIASSSGWGELSELEFYSGTTKLSGTIFGAHNYSQAFDGDTTTMWHVPDMAGSNNQAGMIISECGSGCTAPSAPSISKTSGTTVCAATSQSVTLTATGCSGTVTWYKDNVSVGTGATHTTTSAGTYTAKCTVSGCESVSSSSIVVAETSGCSGGSSSCVVNKVRLYFRNSGDCCMDRLPGAKIQGSNDGVSWTDLYTFSTNGTGSWQEFTFSNTTAYSHARFVASATGWGELRELEFYNGTTKLAGTAFGSDNYSNAFDGNTTTEWHGATSAGSHNSAGLEFTECGGSGCTAPSAPSISKTSGTTVCAATSQSVTLTATGCSGSVSWYRNNVLVDTGVTLTTVVAGNYTAKCTVAGCESAASGEIIVTQTSGCASGSVSDILGTYSTIAGGREYTYNKSGLLELQFNNDGTISDVTPGINKSGSISILDSKNVFYMIGYTIFGDNNGTTYKHFDNVYLPDGIYTIRQFVCNPTTIDNIGSFRSRLDGWGSGDVNKYNAKISEIYLSIKTIGATEPDVKSIVPDWLKVSRHMRYQNYSPSKNWGPYSKHIGIVHRNAGTVPTDYQNKGVMVELDIDNGAYYQPYTWYTPSWHTEEYIPDATLYNNGKFWIEYSGNTPTFVLTDQINEKVAPVDPNLYSRMNHFYQGALEQLQSFDSTLTKRQTGLYGPYNYDDFSGLITPGILDKSKATYVQSLTDKLYNTWDPTTSSWRTSEAGYYTSGQINYRNVNHMMYLWNGVHQLPYRLVYVNERIKLGTKTYGGVDRESNWIAFTWPAVETMVTDGTGKIGVELNSTGEIIPFPNGELSSRNNLAIPAPWDEWVTLGFWSTLIGNGFMVWEAPRARFGVDSTKVDLYDNGESASWTPTGGSTGSYSPGLNGAPVKDASGLKNRLWASPSDAAIAGTDMVWAIRDRVTTLSHCSYSSSKGSFTAVPGDSGLHLNGFGPLNTGQYVIKDAYDQNKGIALYGTGSGGSVVIYYNGFLSPHEYEDNVTVTTPSGSVNLGRVYGRKTVVKNL